MRPARELSSLEGDPYLLALAAYRNGPTAVRQTGGTSTRTPRLSCATVKEHTDCYALDTRLGRPSQAKPPVAPSAPTVAQPPPARGAQVASTGPPSAKPGQPSSKPGPGPAGAKQIFHQRTGLCVSSGSTGDRTRLTLRKCAEEPAQWWDFRTDGTIRCQGLCLDVAWGAPQDGTAIQVAVCSGTWPSSGGSTNKGGIITGLNGQVRRRGHGHRGRADQTLDLRGQRRADLEAAVTGNRPMRKRGTGDAPPVPRSRC